jgi:hypothetical protein
LNIKPNKKVGTPLQSRIQENDEHLAVLLGRVPLANTMQTRDFKQEPDIAIFQGNATD